MTDIEQAALAEKTAEQKRAQADNAWRQAWWRTTLALAEPPDSDRKAIITTYDIAEHILGQNRSYLSERRRLGSIVVVLEHDEISTLPPRLALEYMKSNADPARAVAVLKNAESRELSLRDFAAELGTQPQSWLREDEQDRRSVT